MQQRVSRRPSKSLSATARAYAYEAQDNATEDVLRDAMKATKRARRLLSTLKDV